MKGLNTIGVINEFINNKHGVRLLVFTNDSVRVFSDGVFYISKEVALSHCFCSLEIMQEILNAKKNIWISQSLHDVKITRTLNVFEPLPETAIKLIFYYFTSSQGLEIRYAIIVISIRNIL